MVRIRLRRVGAKKQPYYRVVVADQRSPRDGRHIETIGHYDPRTEPETVNIKEDRALYWLSRGAQPSDVVLRFLQKQGTMERLGRFKAGEDLDALVAEYEAGAADDAPDRPAEVEEVEAEVEADVLEPEAVVPEVEETEAETGDNEAAAAEETGDTAEEEV